MSSRYRFLLIALCAVGLPFIAHRAWSLWAYPGDDNSPRFQIDSNYKTARERQAEVVAAFGGEQGYGTVLNAERIEAFRIEPPERNPHASGPDSKVIGGPVTVSYWPRRELSGLFTR